MKVKIINTSISHYYNQVFSNSCLQELRFHKIFLLEIKFLVKLKVGWNWNAIRNVLILIVKEKISIKCPKMSMAIILKTTTRKYYEKKKFEKKKKFIKICTMHISRVPISVFRKQGSKPFFSWLMLTSCLLSCSWCGFETRKIIWFSYKTMHQKYLGPFYPF